MGGRPGPPAHTRRSDAGRVPAAPPACAQPGMQGRPPPWAHSRPPAASSVRQNHSPEGWPDPASATTSCRVAGGPTEAGSGVTASASSITRSPVPTLSSVPCMGEPDLALSGGFTRAFLRPRDGEEASWPVDELAASYRFKIQTQPCEWRLKIRKRFMLIFPSSCVA